MKFAFGALAAVVSLAAVTGLASHAVSASEPDTWIDECAMLSRPGERAIQASLLYDCQTNVAAYPEWQAWLRKAQPPTHVLWGRYDPSFIAPGAEAYGRDLPGAEIHLLDAGHFALDEKVDPAIEHLVQRAIELGGRRTMSEGLHLWASRQGLAPSRCVERSSAAIPIRQITRGAAL